MIIRPAKVSEIDQIRTLAEKFNLDTINMIVSEFLVAEEENQIIGFGKLIKHPDCLEISALGVIKEKQHQGIGSKLVFRLLEGAGKNDVYLTTINPPFFEKLGFKRTLDYPKSIEKKQDWCEGCQPEKCVVMKYEHTPVS